jgi:hypothetical protein
VQPRGGQAPIRGNMPIPSDGTTFSHNIKEDGSAIRTNGERPRWITPYQKTSIYKSNIQVCKSQIKVQKIFKILVKLGHLYTNGVTRIIPREGFGLWQVLNRDIQMTIVTPQSICHPCNLSRNYACLWAIAIIQLITCTTRFPCDLTAINYSILNHTLFKPLFTVNKR